MSLLVMMFSVDSQHSPTLAKIQPNNVQTPLHLGDLARAQPVLLLNRVPHAGYLFNSVRHYDLTDCMHELYILYKKMKNVGCEYD